MECTRMTLAIRTWYGFQMTANGASFLWVLTDLNQILVTDKSDSELLTNANSMSKCS